LGWDLLKEGLKEQLVKGEGGDGSDWSGWGAMGEGAVDMRGGVPRLKQLSYKHCLCCVAYNFLRNTFFCKFPILFLWALIKGVGEKRQGRDPLL
jgi:hypothetical protein